MKDRQPNVVPAAVVKAMPHDNNRDGKVDSWAITLNMRNPRPGYVLDQSNLIVAFDYESTGEAGFKTQALAYSQIYAGKGKNLSAKRISTEGLLNLRQSVAIDNASIDSSKVAKSGKEDWFNLLAY